MGIKFYFLQQLEQIKSDTTRLYNILSEQANTILFDSINKAGSDADVDQCRKVSNPIEPHIQLDTGYNSDGPYNGANKVNLTRSIECKDNVAKVQQK